MSAFQRLVHFLTVTNTSNRGPARVSAVNSDGFEAPAGVTAEPVILAPVHRRLHVLLVPAAGWGGTEEWGLPGGFMSRSEAPEVTAQRKLTEKTGIGEIYLEQLGCYASPERDPRGWIPSIAYLALIPATTTVAGTGAVWMSVDELPTLVCDHARIIGDGVERLRGKLWWSNISVGLLPPRFTMKEARDVFESISGMRYEPSNFRRQLEVSGLVRATGEVIRDRPGRPAMLYEFFERTLRWSSRRSRPPAVMRRKGDRHGSLGGANDDNE